MPQKKEIQIVKMNSGPPDEPDKVTKNTTVPLAIQPRNIRDTAEVSTPHSKKKQVRNFHFHSYDHRYYIIIFKHCINHFRGHS